MNSRITQLIIAALLLGWGLSSYAQVYRCVDKAGHVTFTQQRCAPGQSSEVVNLGQTEAVAKPKPAICKQVARLAKLVFPHIRQTDSILDIYSALGGRGQLSAGITAAVNYVFTFRYNPKAGQAVVVALTQGKCLDGGFGNLTSKDLPDWSKIKYAEAQTKPAKPTKPQVAADNKTCQQYLAKLSRLRKQMATAKTKSARMQARVNLEYEEGLRQEKCGSAPAK
jgi:hypothetical protein